MPFNFTPFGDFLQYVITKYLKIYSVYIIILIENDFGELMEYIKGLIVKGSGGLYDLLCQNGERISCRAKGAFRHEAVSPLVGDRVTLLHEGGSYVIESIEERRNMLIRPSIANLDRLFIVIPSARPEADLFTVDKLSSIARYNNIEVVMIVSKCALSRKKAMEIADIYTKSGFRLFVTDSPSGEGVENIKDYINKECKAKIIAFAGASGVGKSTLINNIFNEFSRKTDSVSEKTGRGRHTTRTVELFETENGGFIADTPGFTMLDFERFDFFDLGDLPGTFIEFERYLGKCRYTKCTHTKEEGCAIIEALERGEIAKSRHESYKLLYEILKRKQPYRKK